MKRQIVIADRGWVFVGETSQTETGVVIHNAAVVRRWGTTRGLGQLAKEGPTPDTRLDPCSTVHIPTGSVVAIMECEPWPT